MSTSLQPKAAKAPKELGKPFNPGVQVNRIRFSPDGKLLSAACFDGRVRHWVVTGKEPVERPALNGHNGWISDIAFLPSSERTQLFSVDSWGRLTATDLSDKPENLWSIANAHDGWARAVAVSSDRALVATSGRDGFVRFWSAHEGKPGVTWKVGADVLSIAFHPDSHSLYAGDLFGVVREFDYARAKPGRTFETKELYKLDRIQDVGGVKCLLISSDGKLLFAGGAQPKTGGFVQGIPLLIAFDRSTGKRLGHFKGTNDSEGYVTDLAWHPDSYVIGTTSGQPGQGKLFFWKPSDETPSFLGGKLPNCHSVALHPDGDKLAVSATNANSSGNGRVKGAGGDYPTNSSPIQMWNVPKT